MSPSWWLLLALALLVVEMLTPGMFFFACLAAGALLTALAAWLGGSQTVVWAVFSASSALMVIGVAPLARRWMKRIPAAPVGLDSLKGQRARVVADLDPASGKGQVRLDNGAVWIAITEQAAAAETWVEVLEVVGTRLRVRPIPSPTQPKE